MPAKGTTLATICFSSLRKFQLPCPRRARRQTGRNFSMTRWFQLPCPRRARHNGICSVRGEFSVSTTVPAKGTTAYAELFAVLGMFQLPCPRRARLQAYAPEARRSGFNYRAREGHDGITVLYGNTNIFFPILREVCDLRICMVLCL